MQTDRHHGITGALGMKAPCVVATTEEITLSGEQTIDNVAVVTGDRVLVKDQSNTVDNGIWEASTGTWTRAYDFNGTLDIANGTIVPVHGGTLGAHSLWQVNSTEKTPKIGTDDVTFDLISGGGGLNIPVSAFMITLLDDTNAAQARSTLGAAATNGSVGNDFAAKNLTVATSILFQSGKVDSSGWLGLGTTTPARLMDVVESSTSSTRHTSKIKRTTSHTGGSAGYVNSALYIEHEVGASVTNYEWALTAVMNNYATAGENVALYGQGNKRSTGPTWGAVAQAADHTGTANPTTGLFGLEVDIGANGTDNNNARFGIQMVAYRVNPAGATNEVGTGLYIGVQLSDLAGSYYDSGILLRDDMVTALNIASQGSHSVWGIRDTGSRAVGAEFAGTYSSAAIRIKAGEKLAFDTSGIVYLQQVSSVLGLNGTWFNFSEGFGVTSGSGNIATSATSGSASALPATPTGYLRFRIDGTKSYKIPYYSN